MTLSRSQVMARVHSTNTQPEILLRRHLHRLGYGFRLHAANLPGSPDIVFLGRRKVIYLHGCFWHRHEGCRRATTPKNNAAYWETKFARNVARDERVILKLQQTGWTHLVVWECELKDGDELEARLIRFLGLPRRQCHRQFEAESTDRSSTATNKCGEK